MKTSLYFSVICLFLLSCNQTSKYDGQISVDETWGTSKVEFKNGVREGPMVNYYRNGVTRDSLTYSDDKQNGRIFHYDSSGVLESEEYAYFGLKVGPRIEYREGKISRYSFIDFNKTILFECKYDSGRCTSISSFEPNPVLTDSWLRDERVSELSTYLPRPSKFITTYKLGITYAGDKEMRDTSSPEK